MAAGGRDNVYRALSADEPESRVMEVESMCMNCQENGTTKLLLTSIPYYKAVILMSFECSHCGYRNNEIQSGEAVQEHGTEIVLKVRDQIDIRRQVVKSEYATIEVPEIELTIPGKSQPGEVTTVEGILQRVHDGLTQEQERRKILHPEIATQIENFLKKLDSLMALEQPWTLRLHDPTGNCFIQNPDPMHVDPKCIISHYHRNLDEKKLLGLADDDDNTEEPTPEWKSFEDAKQEVLSFPTDCPNCGVPGHTLMKPTDIPFFTTVIIMAFTCDACGHKTNEVKSGTAIREHGCKITVSIEEPVDLARDVLKSDTCSMSIPELDLEVGPGALCSRFTTVEGLLTATKEQLSIQSSFFIGDSAPTEEKSKIEQFLQNFDDILMLEKKVTLVLDDPAGNSYIMSLTSPLDDPRLDKEYYTRTFDQNEELGLNDMKVENYGEMDSICEEEEEQEKEDLKCAEVGA